MSVEKIFMCAICGAEYKRLASLGIHIKGAHKINGSDYYVKYMNDNIVPKCLCGNDVKFRNLNIGFSKHCSAKCSYHSPDVKLLRESTNVDRYGDINAIGSVSVREKIKTSVLDKYGVDSIGKSAEVHLKIKQTNQERYGVDSVLSLNEIRDKAQATTESRYGTKHAMQSDISKKKSKETSMARYGVEHPMQLVETRNKLYESNMRIYGVMHSSQSEEVKEKTRLTNLTKYGAEYPMQREEVREKSRQSMLANYGVEYSAHSIELKEKQINTNLIKYGYRYATQNEDVKLKARNTTIDRYGVENAMQCDVVRRKAYTSMMTRYGIPYGFMSKESRNKTKLRKRRDMIEKYKPLLDVYGCIFVDCVDNNVKLSCSKCGAITEESWQFMVKCRLERSLSPCSMCLPKTVFYSFIEKEMANYIKTLHRGVVENTRSVIYPKELDVYIPNMKLAFEFNGVLYHNELYKAPDYHINKTNACEAKDIQLIHVYEDDWLYKEAIVKSRIKNLFGKSDIIYARKCCIMEVNSKTANDFLDMNHIQGKCVSKVRYGLYYLGELVALMTFGKSRFEADTTELLRYCSKLNISVVGGASKLFTNFLRNNADDDIVSYADRSWSNGNLYRQLGFQFISSTLPNYSYVVGRQRINRMHYQKHKLVKEGYDASLTEHDIMLSREIYRIYDSGNLKFSYKRNV